MRKKRSAHDPLEPLIFVLRGQRIILDMDLAKVYGVTTTAFNQAVKRNIARFPTDFAFQLTYKEVQNLRSQSVISSSPSSPGKSANRSQSVTGSHGGHRYLPWAFTEHGTIMAANILRSKRATQMSIYVVRAFVRLRQQVLESEVMARRLAVVEKDLRKHNDALLDIYYKIEPLLQPPPENSPKRRIGFQKETG